MNIFEKLNAVDIKELKNIDIIKVKDSLRTNPVVFINTIIVIVTLISAIALISRGQVELQKYKNNTLIYDEKLAAVKLQQDTKKTFDDFKKAFPQALGSNQLIDKFSELAVHRNVRILSLSPAKEKSNEYLYQTTVNLSVESSDYKNIILFVKDIEDSALAIRLEKFSAELTGNDEGGDNEDKKEIPIKADLEVSSVRLK
jgi:Tfp pilus assembly protein PilO